MDNKYMDVVKFWEVHYDQFLWQVYLPIGIWMLIVLAFLLLLFKRFTFGNWTSENPNPNDGETFGMPRGTFRGILTMTLLYVTVVLELVNVRIIGFEQEIHEFLVAFQMMVAFYFGSKVMHHVTSADRSKTEKIAEIQTNTQGVGNMNNLNNSFADESAEG